MRSGTIIDLSFQGDICETINFWRQPRMLLDNWNAARNLIAAAEAGGAHCAPGSLRTPMQAGIGSWHWTNVPASIVLGFLSEYREHPASKKVKTKLLEDYIRTEVSAERLATWTLFVASGSSPRTESLGGSRFRLIDRSWHARTETEKQELRDAGHYRIKRLVNPPDEGADLDQRAWDRAFKHTIAAWEGDPDPAGTKGSRPSRPSGTAIREARPPNKGLLILYPLDGSIDSKVESEAAEIPVIGFAISFPAVDADKATTVKYVVNNVYWSQELGQPNEVQDLK